MTNTTDTPAGSYLRHLERRADNPLFPPQRRLVDEMQREAAHVQDREALISFMDEFRELVQACVELKPTEESEVVLELKGQLDRAYVISAGLMGEQGEVQQAILRLIELMMAAIHSGAAGDPVALEELRQESLAREKNIELLRHAVVADLMNPDSPIPEEELVPTLLSIPVESLEAALWLFDHDELAGIRDGARVLLQAQEAGGDYLEHARAALARIESALNESSE